MCLVFYIFLFMNSFGGNFLCSATDSTTVTPKKFVPIDISGSFNANAIWGTSDDWNSNFKNSVPSDKTSNDDKDAYKEYNHGVDGYAAYYTKSNNETGSIPNDGKVSVGNTPFHLSASSGNDCVRLGWGDDKQFTEEINLGASNVKNIYILGVTAGASVKNPQPPTQFRYTVSSGSSQGTEKEANLYNYFANPSTWGNDANIIGYTQNYHVRTCSREIYRPTSDSDDKPNMQCCKLDTSGLTLDNNNKLTIEYHTSNDSSENDGKGQFLVIFAITAEVEYTKFAPIDVSGYFNSNEIWGMGEAWNNINSRWGHYYTKDPERNNNADGLPVDGKITISDIPFNVNTSNGNDCINVSNNTAVEINFSTPIKVKNLYIIGTLNGFNPSTHENPDNFNVEFYDENSNKITQYTQNLDAYDWCYPRKDTSIMRDKKTIEVKGLETIIETGKSGESCESDESSLVGYKDYNVRNEDKEGQVVYFSGKPAMQCWRLNKFDNDNTSFEDNQISRITFQKTDNTTPSNLMIFGVTAELEEDLNVSDIKHDQFKIACGSGISGNKQVKISTTEGPNNEGMTDATFPYTPTVSEGTNYCTIYDSDKNAYYYFEVTTKKSLQLVVKIPSGLVYNGAAQQLVTGVATLNANDAARPESENTLLKANIYLRIKNATGTSELDTGWCNLNSLANLTAINAGTYNIYYYIDEDNLGDYELINEPSTVTITVTNTVTIG